MLLKNKKTGEMATLTLSSNGEELLFMKNDEMVTHKVKLSDLEEWEDYKEPNEYWCIDWTEVGGIYKTKGGDIWEDFNKEIGNYFETKEEAEKAVKRLRAWKRLKDKGFRFIPEASHVEQTKETGESMMFIACTMNNYHDFVFGNNADINLLFGGGE